MITMVDEIYDRAYQQGRSQLNDGIDRAISRFAASIGTTFRVMQAINFAAPWARPSRPARDVGCA